MAKIHFFCCLEYEPQHFKVLQLHIDNKLGLSHAQWCLALGNTKVPFYSIYYVEELVSLYENR